MLKEFREFAMKGNLIDIAVAFVMGAGFTKIVTTLNEGVVMPLVGMVLGGFDLSKEKMVLKDGAPEVKDAAGNIVTPAVAEVAIRWGVFVTAIIDFIIVAFVMFLIVKAINNMRKKQEIAPAAVPEPSLTDKLLMEIRDSLKK